MTPTCGWRPGSASRPKRTTSWLADIALRGPSTPDGFPWDRARFLQVREAFLLDWKHRGGIEASLVETLAIAHIAQPHWTERLTVLSTTESRRQEREVEQRGGWNPPTVDAAAAIDQAAAMVDRFNRLFVRTLRALATNAAMRRRSLVQKVDQLNVGAQQVNLAAQPTTGQVAEQEEGEQKGLKAARSRKARHRKLR